VGAVGFSGAVLTGGRSSRMGVDKATVEVRGRPLAAYPRDALRAAGAMEVVAVGGDPAALAVLGLTVVPDAHPGQGPLGGILAALRWGRAPLVVVLACDLPAMTPEVVRRLVEACEDDVDAVVPVLEGHPQVVAAAWRRRALDAVGAAFERGCRAPRELLSRLRIRELADLPPEALVDLDHPGDLRRYDRGDPGAGQERRVQVPEIDVTVLEQRLRDGAPLIDVRQPDEYEHAHVPGAVLIPLGDVPDRVHELPRGTEVYVICRSGKRSHTAALFMLQHGIEAVNVAGGTLAWLDAGKPTVHGPDAV